MVDGKAKLLRDDYCDGLGDCLPACPTGAITFVEREAAAYDEAAVIRNQRPLQQWPVQIKLVPTSAPYFDGAKLLIAADCTAYAYASFHEDFKNEKIVLVGCPKLDSVDYSEKLEEIIRSNNITEVTIVLLKEWDNDRFGMHCYHTIFINVAITTVRFKMEMWLT